MLVLSRKLGEKILLPGCDVTITVMAISSNRVRIGITAPLSVRVQREELTKDKRDEKKEDEAQLLGHLPCNA